MNARTFALTCLALTLPLATACEREPIVLDPAGIELAFVPARIDLGPVTRGATVRASAQLAHTGEVAARLARTPRLDDPASGFILSALVPESIAPGARIDFDVTFTAAGAPGPRIASAVIVLAETELDPPVRLELVAQVVDDAPDAGAPAPDAAAPEPAPDGGTPPPEPDGGARPDATSVPDAAPTSACDQLPPLVPTTGLQAFEPEPHHLGFFSTALPSQVGQAVWSFDGERVWFSDLDSARYFDGDYWKRLGAEGTTWPMAGTSRQWWGRSPGELWFASDFGVTTWDDAAFTLGRTVNGQNFIDITGDASGRYAWASSTVGGGLWRYVGGGWVLGVPTPPAMSATSLAVRGRDDVWLTTDSGTIHRYDGTALVAVNAPRLPQGETIELVAAGSEIWALYANVLTTASNTSAVFSTVDGATWTDRGLSTGMGERLADISATGTDDVWVVGNDRVMRWDGRTWDVPTGICSRGPSGELRAVHAYAPGRAVVAGESVYGATVARWDGQEWAQLTDTDPGHITTISVADARTAWAGASGGRLYRRDDRGWKQRLRLPGRPDVLDLVGLSADEAYVATAQGLLRVHRGAATPAPGAPVGAYRALASTGGGVVWGAGDGGTTVRCSFGACGAVASGTTEDLTALAVSNTGEAWVGGGTFLARHNGNRWVTERAPTGTLVSLAHAGQLHALTSTGLWSRDAQGQWVAVDVAGATSPLPYDKLCTLEGDLWALGRSQSARRAPSGFVVYPWGALDADTQPTGGAWMAGDTMVFSYAR